MRLGTLETGGLTLWIAVVFVAAFLGWSGRRHALEAFGASAAKERRTALAAGAIPPLSLLLALLFVGVSFAASAGAAEGGAGNPGGPWAAVGIWLVLGNATVAMVCCALIVIGMLRGTSNGHVLAGDALTAVAGLVSLWAVASNLAPV